MSVKIAGGGHEIAKNAKKQPKKRSFFDFLEKLNQMIENEG